MTGGIRGVNITGKEQRKQLINEIKRLEVEFKQRTEREVKLWEARQKKKAEESGDQVDAGGDADSPKDDLKPFVMNMTV